MQRERERQSARWDQLDALMSGGAPIPEPGFAWALNYQVTRQAAAAQKAIEWALRDPGRHGASRGGFYPVMDTMIRDEHFWAEAPIYALHYDVHGMFSLAEAALRYDGTDLYKFVSPKSGASLKKM